MKTIKINLNESNSNDTHGFEVITGIRGDAAEIVTSEVGEQLLSKYRFIAKRIYHIQVTGIKDVYLNYSDYARSLIRKVKNELVKQGYLKENLENGFVYIP